MTNPILPTAGVAELLASVEAATGPEQELDALIMCALVAGPGAYVEQSKFNGKWCIYTAPNCSWQGSVMDGMWRDGGWPLTASLDAALALCERVLPGWLIRLEIHTSHARIQSPDYVHDFGGLGATTPLALLAALLKAKANLSGAA